MTDLIHNSKINNSNISIKHKYGLDALRAIASLIVVFGHIEGIKASNKIANWLPIIPSGYLGVILFFVISGFLITSLLLQEEVSNKSINIKKFYLRRILRIWPLYYLILFISVILFDYRPEAHTIFLYLTIFPNIARSLNYDYWLVSPQIWSIGVEEQFYLVWPWLIKFIKSRLLAVLIIIAVGYTFLPHVILYIINKSSLANSNIPKIIGKIYYTTKFNCMAMGGIFAYLIHHNKKIIQIIRHKYIATLLIFVPFVLWFFNINFFYFTAEVYAILFCFLIVNITHKKHYFFDNKITFFLGKISYGIYMYHCIVILLLFKWLLPLFENKQDYYANILLYVSAIFFTVLTATLSYYTIERYFLTLKRKFETT